MFWHVLIPVAFALQAGVNTEAPGGALINLDEGKKALLAHDYTKAAEKFRAALASSEEATGQENFGLEALRRLAAVSRLQGHSDEAERTLMRAVPLAAKLHGDTSLELAAVLSDLSGAQRASGKRKEALLSLESAIRMREERPTEQLSEFANDLLSAATIRIDFGDTGAAKELLNRALPTCEKALPPESPQCIRILDALAGLLRDRSEYSEAEPLYARMLRLREATLGPDAADLISTLDSLAYVYFGLRRYDDAQPVYERLLALWETSAGAGHPMVALTLDKMAEFFAAQNRYVEVDALIARATAIRTKALVDSLDRSGRMQLAQSRLKEAEQLYKRAVLVADEGSLPEEVIEPLVRTYAKILRDLDRGAEAEALEQRIAEILLRRGAQKGLREAPAAGQKP